MITQISDIDNIVIAMVSAVDCLDSAEADDNSISTVVGMILMEFGHNKVDALASAYQSTEHVGDMFRKKYHHANLTGEKISIILASVKLAEDIIKEGGINERLKGVVERAIAEDSIGA